MSINKCSSSEEICNFLKALKIKDEFISKFKDENIKGNELFYLTDKDFDDFGISMKKKNVEKKIRRNKKFST